LVYCFILVIYRAAYIGTPGNRAARHFWRVLPGASSASKGTGELKRAASTVSFMSTHIKHVGLGHKHLEHCL